MSENSKYLFCLINFYTNAETMKKHGKNRYQEFVSNRISQ